MLMLPPATHIKASTMDILEKFCAQGGKVGGDALLPYKTVEGDAGDLCGRMEKLFGVNPVSLRDAFLARDEKGQELLVKTNGRGGKAVALTPTTGWRCSGRPCSSA